MISARIIADSISPAGKRITTFEIEFPRFVLAEFNTHRMLSRNSASSRAIPIEKVIENIQNNPAIPVWWGKNQSGMQAKEELDNEEPIWEYPHYEEGYETGYSTEGPTALGRAKEIWLEARDAAINFARQLSELGLHKQIVNRILEPWVMTKVITTATDWDNFFHLRNHPDAQPEIHELARLMWETYKANTPSLLMAGEWHLPYIETRVIRHVARYFSNGEELSLEHAQKVSASLCAQVSYRKADESLDKALLVYDRLVTSTPVHASPFEHQATPLEDPKEISGNFRGWQQFRQLIPNNNCEKYFLADSPSFESPPSL